MRAVTLEGSRAVRVAPPTDSLIADWYPSAYLVDSYTVDLPPHPDESMRSLAKRALGTPPLWFRLMLGLRDAMVRPFGLKTSRELRLSRAKDQSIDFFPVIDERENEIVLGEDDRHLDFRLSILRSRKSGGTQVIVTTVVDVHNGLGRAYIGLIRPFHHLVVRRSVLRLARRPG